MRDRAMKPANLHLARLLAVFAVLAVALLVLLAVAPARSVFPEWRTFQEGYNALANAQGASPVDLRIRQVFHADGGVVDRCQTCHLTHGAAPPLAGDPLFAEHPPIPHDVGEFGCTPCHGGQGRATTREDAHGHVRFWDDPMLEPGMAQAGCGSCHTRLPVPSIVAGPRGEDLFRRYDCTACHRVDGVGRGNGPDLSAVGLQRFRRAGGPAGGGAADPTARWHADHLARLDRREAGWEGLYGPIPDADVAAITEYLRGRVGAPALARGKAAFLRNGCLGCHKVNGVGGDEAPDLTREGLKPPADLDFRGVSGPHTPAQWHREHLKDPGRVVAGSRMPPPDLAPEEVEDVTLYLMSLRPRTGPVEWMPADRLAGERMGVRDVASDGATLYAAFCSGCHGPRGEGRRYANRDTVFPAVRNPDFLALASDEYLRKTISLGRPGRPMPAWKDAGLGEADIEAIIAFLRSPPGQEATRPPEPLALPPGDARSGADLYARHCAGCHGPTATEGEAPALRNPAFLAAAEDSYIAGTILRGRPGTAMRHFGQATVNFPVLDEQEVADILAFLRAPATGTNGEAR